LNAFLLTDDKLRMNNEYSVMPGSSKVSDSWYAVITGANGIPTTTEISDELKAAYEKAKAKLMDKDDNPTPHYEKYMKYQDEWKDKVRKWHKAYADAFTNPTKLQSWPIEGTLYHDDADEAFDRWTSLGFKQEIENAIATLAAQGTDPAIALISRSKKRFVNSLIEFQNIGQIPYTVILPSSWYDPDNDDGWNQYSSQDFHTESHYKESSTSYKAGVGGFLGGFWGSGSLNKGSSQKSLNIQTENLEVSFKYSVADIKRAWLDTSMLNLENWFLMGDYKKHCISTGKMAQELPRNGIEPVFLPSLVTSWILIKDLDIKWTTFKSDWEAHENSTGGRGGVGWGPFAIRGSYDHHGKERNFTADTDGESLKVAGIQLLGYVSAINPGCPAKDSSEFLKKPEASAVTPTS
jgi:hypothetical protein